MRTIRMMLAVVSALALVACDDDPSDYKPGPTSTYAANVTGAMQASLKGRAIFGDASDENGTPVFSIILGEDTSRHVLALSRPKHGRPAKGTHPFANVSTSGDHWRGVYVISDGEELEGLFIAESGSLRITESADNRLRGTFTFSGAGFMNEPGNSVKVTVTGSFDAGKATASLSVTSAGR